MKKDYEAPKAELMEFDYTDTAVASNTGRTDEANTQWYTCNHRYVDVHSIDDTVCGHVPADQL